ncbi:MAG: Uma2 family endonuclease [Caldilinea sp.]|nr:Uma2 family endonuclease [Caldilinea sp.]
MSALLKPLISPRDYLAAERTSVIKHEYHAGKVYAMAGASERHNLIVVNLVALLHGQLRRRTCTVYPSDMRVKVVTEGLYTYPDISVVCGAPQFEDEHRDTLLNPTLIVEVLSPSTENYDRGRKFQSYRSLPSLMEYVLVAQDQAHVEHYIRQPDGRWLLAEYSTLAATVRIDAIGCELTLTDIYEKVELDSSESSGGTQDV